MEQVQVPQMSQPTYNGLRGDEMIEVLVSDFRKMLTDHPAFSAGLCHHSPRYKITLRMSSYPYEESQIHKFAAENEIDNGPVIPGTTKQTGQFSREHQVEFPDLEREKAGLVVPDLQATGDGSLSDYSEDPFAREVREGVQVPAATEDVRKGDADGADRSSG